MKALVLNVTDAILEPSTNTEKKFVDDMYYQTNRGPIAIASLLKPEHFNVIENLLKSVRYRRESLRHYEYHVFGVVFRDFRI